MRKKRVALVTGATQGIGKAIVKELVKNDFRIIALSRTATKIKQLITEFPNGIVDGGVCDITHAEAVRSFFSTLRRKYKSIDVLVNNAGVGYVEPVSQMSIEHWKETLDVNLTGTFLVTQQAIPFLSQSRQAHIFMIGSVAGKEGFSRWSAYSASKFGLMGFTQALREELRAEGIRVTSIVSGAVHTKFWDHISGDFNKKKMMAPSAVAKAIIYAYFQTKNTLIEEVVLKPSSGNL